MPARKPKVVSLSGHPVQHHRREPLPFTPPRGEDSLAAIARHVERWVGPIHSVFHELISDAVHIDLHHVRPTSARPYHTLVSSGMSDLPMELPAGVKAPRAIELVLTLPERWVVGDEAFADDNWYWPVRQLKTLARFPHKYESWLGWGHTVTNGDPPQPLAPTTRLCGAVLLSPFSLPPEFFDLPIGDGKTLQFLAVVPLYEEEMALKLREGAEGLLARFEDCGVTDVIDPVRPNVARRRSPRA